ncbi:hypothetical protein ACIOG3_03895 [Yersinia rochesterensis]|uniref:hypothetical protein n=1 Tax=Yersinia rochesterensis TaxID=1604335 RepID=UPI0004F7BC80|nr:hypothetical protein [Yersinia rochesterensis]AIN16591.1 hypothetical protein DJ57_2568 [Yersinia rochesterensis]CRY63087.1 Uncharacterised protein [Yersinia kristensenii]
MSKSIEALIFALKEAAHEEIMLRESGDTSDNWQDEASPENVLLLIAEVERLNSPEIRKLILSEVSDFCAGLGQPGEPELPEDIQQALMNRIELVFNNCG